MTRHEHVPALLPESERPGEDPGPKVQWSS